MVRETGRSKPRPSLPCAAAVCLAALPLPVRPRIAFVLAVNFLHNRVLYVLRVAAYFMSRRLTGLLINAGYFLVVGPVALLARLLGRDYLGAAEQDSFFRAKEPPDASAERFLRQY